MNYLEMIKRNQPEKIALIHDGISYTYGELVDKAEKLSQDITIFNTEKKIARLHIIQRESILDQLLEFFACSKHNLVPVIALCDIKNIPRPAMVPEHVCMGIMTSGTSGVPKVLFRTYESWADFFPIQNKIFNVREDSRLFVQGSLAFTGNLNLYLAQFFAGATVVAQNHFNPKQWVQVIEREQVDMIYLIPSKLMYLPYAMEIKGNKRKNLSIKMILSGSQSLGKKEAEELKQYFPKAKLLLYYGASEVSYITYVLDENMSLKRNLVGKPFPEVNIFIKKEKKITNMPKTVCGEIFVDTPYHVEGIACPYTLSDRGYLDEKGNLYFEGRKEDIFEIHGRKFSAIHIEHECNMIEPIKESAALLVTFNEKPIIIVFVCLEKETIQMDSQGVPNYWRFLGRVKDKKILEELRKKLSYFEMPNRIIAISEMPRKESGKIDKKELEREWRTGK